MADLRRFTNALRAETGPCQPAQPAGFGPICPGVSALPSQAENATPSFLTPRKGTTSWRTTASLAITHLIISALAKAGQVCSGFSLSSRVWAFWCSSVRWGAVQLQRNAPVVSALIPSPCQLTTRLSSNEYFQSLSASGGRQLAPVFAARVTHPKFLKEFCQENSNFLGATLIGGTKC